MHSCPPHPSQVQPDALHLIGAALHGLVARGEDENGDKKSGAAATRSGAATYNNLFAGTGSMEVACEVLKVCNSVHAGRDTVLPSPAARHLPRTVIRALGA